MQGGAAAANVPKGLSKTRDPFLIHGHLDPNMASDLVPAPSKPSSTPCSRRQLHVGQSALVVEQSAPRECHPHAVVVARPDDLVVAVAPARLHNPAKTTRTQSQRQNAVQQCAERRGVVCGF